MGYIKTCVVVLIIAMVLSLVLSYAEILTIIQALESNTERVLDSFVIENATQIYDSIKNGSDFTLGVNTSHFVESFSQDCKLDFYGGFLYNRDNNGRVNYWLTVPNINFAAEQSLKLNCTFDLIIPLTFAGKQVSTIRIPIKVNSGYNLKF